jgi:hypothetical protein
LVFFLLPQLLPISDRDVDRLGMQCPRLQEIESVEGETLWKRNRKTGRFTNEFLFSSSGISDEGERNSDETEGSNQFFF